MKNLNKRVIGVDLVKIIAAMLVIIIHHLGGIGFYKTPFGSKGMVISTFIHMVSLSCVPLFLVATGYLLSERTITKKHYIKFLDFILEVLLIFAAGEIMALLLRGEINFQLWLSGMKHLLKEPPYYIGLYISTYLMSPFYNILFKNITDKQKHFLIIILIFVISIPNVLNKVIGSVFFDTRPINVWSTMYYFLGLYIRYFRPKLKRCQSFLIFIILNISYVFIVSRVLRNTTFSYLLGYYENVFTVLITASIFLVVYSVDFGNIFIKRIIVFLSGATMSFYLGSSIYSDSMAMKYISLTGNLFYDLKTIPAKVSISMLYSLPLAGIVYVFSTFIRKGINNFIEYKNIKYKIEVFDKEP